MKKRFLVLYIAVLYMLISPSFIGLAAKPSKAPEVVNLKTEYQIDPVGIEDPHPVLSWEIRSTERGIIQKAYEIRAACSGKDLSKGPYIWKTGEIISGQSINIPYRGEPLQSGQRVFWQVRVTDNKGKKSDWSELANWEMGLLEKSDWKAVWIEPGYEENTEGPHKAAYLRKEFRISKKVTDARLYVTAHGLYTVRLNGKKAGDQLFTPGWTSYNKRLQYQVYDVTDMVRKGDNAIGAILGDGWYRGPFAWTLEKNHYGTKTGLLLQVLLTFDDGSAELVCSDDTWKSSTGPILKSEIYDGEIYDARQEMKGWDQPGFMEREWTGCIEKSYSLENLVPDTGVPVRATDTITPISKFVTSAGDLVFDLGQNMVGWVRFSLQGEKGSEIILHHAEVLDKEGNIYLDNLRNARQEIRYIFNGDGMETYEPHFTFQGFRYVVVSGYQGDISTNDLQGIVIHSDLEPIGSFACSDTLLNQLQSNIVWGLKGNFLDIPTDCPQRDERMGWTGDAQVFAPTASFNMNTVPFFRKWMQDVAADQREDGSVPWVVPMIVDGGGGTGWSDGYGATGWADAAVIIPWTVYKTYGDEKIIRDQYSSMKAWEDYMIRHAGDRYIFDYGFHFGDWLAFAEYMSYFYNAPDYGYAGANTDKDLIATAYFYHTTGLMQKIAGVLGYNKDEAFYASLLPKIKAAFNKEFMTQTGRLASGTQTAYALALGFGLIPDDYIEGDAARLAADVKHFGHLTTGFLGTPMLCQVLSDNGYADLAYMLLFNKRYPSWLYPVTMGATTIWERWDGIKPDSTFQDAGMNSFNHYAYGAIGQWMYSNITGIQNARNAAGYREIVIKPILTSKLSFAEGAHQSPYGRIYSRWSIDGEQLSLDVSIPSNTTATIYIPTDTPESIRESGKPLIESRDFTGFDYGKGMLGVRVGSGDYRFTGHISESNIH